MGIQGLNKFLRDKYNKVHKEVSLANYRYKKVAVDTSLYMYKFKTVYGEENWLSAFIKLVLCLRKNDIHCIFVYDTIAPEEKSATREERKEKRDKLERDTFELEEEVNQYEIDGIITERLQKIINKSELPTKKLLISNSNPNSIFYLNILKQELDKKKKQVTKIDKKDFDLTRDLFTIMKVPWIYAPSEAEAYCSHLCISGLVDCVLSEDSDILAYKCPIFLSKINTSTETVIEILYEDVLKETNLTSEQFTDFCIMCGTDYNKNIPKIGPVMSFKLIKESGSIDNLDLDVSCLNHVRVRDIFTFRDKLKNIQVSYCGTPDYNKLEEFCFINNCYINLDEIKNVNKAKLVFI